MRKWLKKTPVWLVAIVLSFAFVLSACGGGGKTSLTIKTTLQDQTVEVGTVIDVPTATVVDDKGNDVNQAVSIRVYNHVGAIVATTATKVTIRNTGEWKVVYSTENAEDLTVVITCSDLTAPTVSMKGLKRLGYVNTNVELPTFEFNDVSEVDYTKSTQKLYYQNGEKWDEYDYDETANTFKPDKAGVYKLVIYVIDKAGNDATHEYTMLMIGDDWTIPGLPKGYYAAYDSDVYSYLAGIPTMAHGIHWAGASDPVGEFVTGVEGATEGKALKVNIFKGAYGAIFQLVIPTVPAENLDVDGKIVLRLKGGKEVRNWFINDDMTTQNKTVISEPDANGWQVMTIPLSMLDNNAYNLKSIEFISGSSMDSEEAWYIDFIKLTTVLDAPIGLTVADGTLSWDAVTGAAGYTVSVNGEESKVAIGTSFVLGEGDNVIKIKALGNNINNIDSDWSDVFTTFDMEDNYMAMFASEAYEYLVKSGSTPGGSYWNPTSLASKYVNTGDDLAGAKDGDALKLEIVGNSHADRCTSSFKLTLPSGSANLAGEVVALRFKITGITNGSLSNHWVNGANQNCGMVGDKDANGWQLLIIPSSVFEDDFYSFKTLEITVSTDANSAFNFYMDWIMPCNQIAAPTGLSYNEETGTLSWSAVTGAVSYVVKYDDTEHAVSSGTSLAVPKGKVVAVKAVAGTAGYVDSPYSGRFTTMNIPTGYLADYNGEIYEDFVGLNPIPTNAWWDAASIATDYISSGVAGAKDGNALKVSLGRKTDDGVNRAGVNLIIPGVAEGSLSGETFVLRYKTSSNVTVQHFWINNVQYAGAAADISAADSDGWVTFTIPASNIGGKLHGLNTLGIGFGAVEVDTLDLYLDWLKVSTKLQAPENVAYSTENSRVEWTTVDNASGYIVDIDGTAYTTTNTYYDLATPVLVKVKAAGDGLSYVNSDWAVFSPFTLRANYVAEFDNDLYEGFVGIRKDGWWDAKSVTADYVATGVEGAENGDALKMTVTASDDGRASFTLAFPPTPAGTLIDGDWIAIRIKIVTSAGTQDPKTFFDNAAGNAHTWVNGGNQNYMQGQMKADKDGWHFLRINKGWAGNLYSLNEISAVYTSTAGATVDIYFDYAYVEAKA